MSVKPELVEVLVDFIVDYLEVLASSETLNEQNLRMTSNELRVMNWVYLRFRRNEPCNLSFLIDKTEISKATVSRVLTTLFEYGLVREEADENDRRVRYLYPTAAGEASMAQLATWLESWANKVDVAAGAGSE